MLLSSSDIGVTLMHLLLFTITIHLNKLCFVALHMCYINEALCRFLRVLTTINYRNFLTIVNDLRELVSICTQRIRNCNEQLTFLACIAPRTGKGGAAARTDLRSCSLGDCTIGNLPLEKILLRVLNV